MRRLTIIILAALTFICKTNSFAQTTLKRQWPSYRGYMLSGVLDNANFPDTFRQIAEIPLKDICMTAPAITDGKIYFRTQNYLIAVGKK